MTKRTRIVKSTSSFADYDSLINSVIDKGDPFSFLTQLKQVKGEDYESSSILSGIGKTDLSPEQLVVQEANIAQMVRNVIAEGALLPKDTKVDDSGLPQAKNFYEWCTKDSFAGTVMTPFLEQLLWGVIVFGEFCPRCSDMEWLYDTHDVSDTFSTFERKVCLLEYGVCPSCKGRKSEFVNSGEMRFYQELAVCAGQRCVTGDTCTLSYHGMLRIEEFDKNFEEGFTELDTFVHNGKNLEQTSHFFKAAEEHVKQVVLCNGMSIRGTDDHPIFTYDESFVPIKNITTSHVIPVYIGQQIFGSNTEFVHSSDPGIPRSVRTGTKKLVCSYLNCLFEYHAHHYVFEDKISIHCVLSSSVLVTDVSAALNNLGIAHTILCTGAETCITVEGEYVLAYLTQIGLHSEELTNSVSSLYNKSSHKHKTTGYNDVSFVRKDLLLALDRFIYSSMGTHSTLYMDPSPYFLGYDLNRTISKSMLKEISTYVLGIGQMFKVRIDYLDAFRTFADMCSTNVVFSAVREVITSKEKHRTFDFTLPETHQFITGGILSHNSGKSASVGGMLTPYMSHRVLKMQKPTEVYGIANSTMLHGTFCALTYAQAKETLWEFFYGTVLSSKWFQDYHQLLDHYSEVYGQTLYKFNDTFVTYRCRNLMWYPAGPDKRILRGRTRIYTGVDEIGYFDNADTKKIKISASGVYDALDSSLLTVRGAAERLIKSGYDDVLNGMSMNVSSPASQRDKIMELVRSAQTSEVIYGIHRPTWEVNPTLPRDSKVITERYRTDPTGAARDFGAEPPMTANPFIENKAALLMCIGTKRNPIKLRYKQRSETSTRQASRWAVVDNIRRTRNKSCLTIDAGFSNNSFSCTVGRVCQKTGLFLVEVMVEIAPKPGYPLNYTMIYDEIICTLIEKRNVKVFLSDRWNSLKLLSDAAETYGIVARQYSLKYKDLWLIKTMIDQEELVFPALSSKSKTIADCLEFQQDDYPHCFVHQEMDHMVVQTLTVQDTGSQVTKGDNLTDDIFRSSALLCYALSTEEYLEILMGVEEEEDEEQFRPIALGCSKLGSGGGKSSGGGQLSNDGQLGAWRPGR